MRALAILVVLGGGLAGAAPAQLATGACSGGAPTVQEILPPSAVAGSVKILASSAGGLDVFWTSQPEVGDPQFAGMYAAYTASGQRLGKPIKVNDQGIRNVAGDGTGTFAIIYSVFESNGWQAHVQAVQPAQHKQLWDIALPSRERGHGTIGLGWDPKTSTWVLVGEELIQRPDKAPGYVYNRLFTASLDRAGHFTQSPTYLTDPLVSAQLDDWTNPLIVGNGRMAFVWTGATPKGPALYVSELGTDRAVSYLVATGASGYMRVVLAWAAGRYVISGGESGKDPLDSRVFVTTVHDGVAGPMRYPSTRGLHGSEPVIATDGTRVAIAWNEDDMDKRTGERRSTVHAAVVDAHGDVHAAYTSKTPAGQTDWVQSMAWDGCRFALVHTAGINPSAHELVRF